MVSVRQGAAARWATVVAGTALLGVSPALLGAVNRPDTSLPPGTVVSDALHSAGIAHSGLVQVDGWLGLPTLPLQNDATAQLDRSTRVRTWWTSPSLWRTDILAVTGQQEEVAADSATLAWDYESNSVHIRPTLPGLRLPRTADLMPPAAARTLLSWLSARDRVGALPPQQVAGHDASGARVVSGEPASTIGSLDVWVDSVTGLPLELDLFARGNAEPIFRTRFLEVSVQRPDPAVVSPVLPAHARWSTTRRDILSFIQSAGSTVFPSALSGLPGDTGTGLPAGIATYGVGFARLALLELPDRLVPRVEATVGAQSVAVGTGRAAVLRSALLQVAVLETADGRGYLLAGTVGSAAMDAAVRSTLAGLPSEAPG